MHRIIHQDDTTVEIALDECISRGEFLGLLKQLHNMSSRTALLNILFDASGLKDSYPAGMNISAAFLPPGCDTAWVQKGMPRGLPRVRKI